MAWTVRFSETAERELAKLDKPVARRLILFLRERVASLEGPRSVGEASKGSRYGELWKYRQDGDMIVASMKDDVLLVLVVKVGHGSGADQR